MDFTFKFRVPASILSQILVPGVEFCQEGVMGLGHGCRLRVFAPVVGFTCADPAFLPPSAFMYVVPNCGKGRSAQGASQFAAGYAAVRVPHHNDGRPVHIMKTS